MRPAWTFATTLALSGASGSWIPLAFPTPTSRPAASLRVSLPAWLRSSLPWLQEKLSTLAYGSLVPIAGSCLRHCRHIPHNTTLVQRHALTPTVNTTASLHYTSITFAGLIVVLFACWRGGLLNQTMLVVGALHIDWLQIWKLMNKVIEQKAATISNFHGLAWRAQTQHGSSNRMHAISMYSSGRWEAQSNEESVLNPATTFGDTCSYIARHALIDVVDFFLMLSITQGSMDTYCGLVCFLS